MKVVSLGEKGREELANDDSGAHHNAMVLGTHSVLGTLGQTPDH